MTLPGIRVQPVDDNFRTIDSTSFTLIFDIGIADGTFKPVVVPTDCKAVTIQAHNGVETDFTTYIDAPLGFHFSTTGHATNKDYINIVGQIGIERVAPAGTTIGYVRAAIGTQISGGLGA